jgi:hydrogenase expression/formation protein HypE
LPTVARKNTNILPEGKLPIEALEPLLRSLSSSKNDVVIPPSIGVDVGVMRTKGKYLVMSSDPITGTSEKMGWHAVNVSANDVATSGIMPDCLSVVSLFPVGTSEKIIRSIVREINSTASDLGIAVIGGHTEITPGLDRPIIVVTCSGSGKKFVTASMARKNDVILMTKTAGIEGTWILSRLFKVRNALEPRVLKKAENLIQRLSILKEARLAFRTGKVHAMHDTTEGGTIGSLIEMSFASKLGFELEIDSVPIDDSTRMICKVLSIDPLKLIGSGSLLIACPEGDERKIINLLKTHRIECTKIGRFLSGKVGRILKTKDGSSIKLRELTIQDELWPILDKYGNFS